MYGAIVTTPALSINVRVFEVVEAIRNRNMPRHSPLLLAMTRGSKMMRRVRRSAVESASIRRVRKRAKILAPIKGGSSHTTRARIIHLSAKLPLWDERPVKPDRRPIDPCTRGV